MAEPKVKDPADRRSRAVMSALLIMLVIGGGAIEATSEHADQWRSVDFVKMGSILVLAFILSLRATSAMRLTQRNPVLDDELTRANRASAACWGFWSVMAAALAVFVSNFYVPMGVAMAAPILIIAGSAAAGIRFVYLERRS